MHMPRPTRPESDASAHPSPRRSWSGGSHPWPFMAEPAPMADDAPVLPPDTPGDEPAPPPRRHHPAPPVGDPPEPTPPVHEPDALYAARLSGGFVDMPPARGPEWPSRNRGLPTGMRGWVRGVVLPAAFIGVIGVGMAACANRQTAPLPTVASVDLPGYMGAWYEITKLPNRFQAQCVADTQARYAIEGSGDGARVRVINRCRTADGKVEEAKGIAYAVDGSNNAKLKVSFFRPFYGDYWVLAFGPANGWVLIGEPGRDYGWVLSRTPSLDDTQLTAALDRAVALGYTKAAFQQTPQTQPLQ